ncbi:BRCT domain-containing protein, partial [Xylona heveae TC161]
MEQNGGICTSPFQIGEQMRLEHITHIISSTSDFPEYFAAIDRLISVVKPEWVHACLAKKKLSNPRQYSPDPRLFLSGVTICCADIPTGDKDAIIGGVLATGGLYSNQVTKLVTHIVALTENNDKCRIAQAKRLKCKTVLPHWFDDCLKLGRRIDERPYMLPNPEVLLKGPEEPVRILENTDIYGASSPHAGRLPTPTGSVGVQRRELTVFQGKKVMLSQDLGIGGHLRGTIEDLITRGGGLVTGSIYNADILVCHYREGKDYVIASRAGKDVGNLPWLYHLIAHNSWTSPMRRLLHYPLAKTGLPGFKGYRVSLSNYNGEARIYLENLIKAAGGEFTKTLNQDNTHLISAHTVSEKCIAAREWNIPVINHLWLEESYAAWRVQSLTTSRYTCFPPRTNLGEVIGQTEIDRNAIEHFFFPGGPERILLDESGKVLTGKHQTQKKSSNSLNADDKSHSFPSDKVHTLSSQDEAIRAGTPMRNGRVGARAATGLTPSTPRTGGEGKENETPSTVGSRGAKDRAVARLHDLAPDIALYEKEKRRQGGVIFGGRRMSDQDSSRKRTASSEFEPDMTNAEKHDPKRPKKGRPAATIRLLITGYKRWVEHPRKEDEDRRRLRDLGILIIQDPATCTHLAAPQILRTQKFICSIASGPTVISTDFVDHCLENGELLSPEAFLLNDPEKERLFDFKLKDAISRAKSNKRGLLRGRTIYCTENVHGGFGTYKNIIEANGGHCQLYRARAGATAPLRKAAQGIESNGIEGELAYSYLISDPSPEEKRLWNRFEDLARKQGSTPRIVSADWILNVAMSQTL